MSKDAPRRLCRIVKVSGRTSKVAPHFVETGQLDRMVAGLALVLLDQSAYDGDNDERAKDYRDTLVPGLVVTGVGAAALGVGIYLLLTADDQPPPVAVFPGPDSLVLSWQGRF